jgi:anthranilate phosphoribosyltransferase
MNDAAPTFAEAFRELSSPDGLSVAMTRRVFDGIFSGAWSPLQVAGFVVALRLRGETAAVIAAATQSLRDAMIAVDHSLPRVLDTCGTGGDGFGTLNLSTAAAIVVASEGIPVAKHGNRAVSSRAGSADVIEALGIPIDLPPQAAKSVLAAANIAFLLAPSHHPAMRHAAQARRELGIRSIFNCLGPLANPARATHQLIGAYDDALLPIFAETLRSLGTQRAWIVRGHDGLDEVSPQGPTHVVELDGDVIRRFETTPEDFGLRATPLEQIRGGDAQYNAKSIELVLTGAPHAATDAIVLNAAAALVVAERMTPRDAAARALGSLRSGRARATLESWRRAALAARAEQES